MGATASNAKYGKTKKGKRGSVNNASRLEAFTGGRKTGSAEWATCGAEMLKAVVVGVTAMGGAITFGLSRDEGAHSLTMMLDDSRVTLWFNGDAVLDDELQDVLNTLDAVD